MRIGTLGLGGRDRIAGGPGDDTLIWSVGDGPDTIDGGPDTDIQHVNGSDRSDGVSVRADGSDVVFGSFMLDELFDPQQQGLFVSENDIVPQFRMSAVEVLEADGREGNDTLSIGDLSGTGLSQITVHGGADNDWVESAMPLVAFGDGGSDTLLGSAGNDTLRGDNDPVEFAGDDVLEGRGGEDELFGDAGNDTLKGGRDNDTLDGGTGFDLIDLSDATAGVTFTLVQSETDTFVDLSAVGLGRDTYLNMEGVIGSEFSDTLIGSAGNDVLSGLSGDNRLFGGPGNDLLLDSGPGRDTLNGGEGSDLLVAEGAGPNVFVYETSAFGFAGADVIPFFTPGGEDQIVLSRLDFGVASFFSSIFLPPLFRGRISGPGGQSKTSTAIEMACSTTPTTEWPSMTS